MSGCVAVLDIGKTNIKVVVFDAAGTVVAERSHPNASLPPDARWPYLQLHTEGAWAFLIGALKELGAQFADRRDFDLDAWRGGRAGRRRGRRAAGRGL